MKNGEDLIQKINDFFNDNIFQKSNVDKIEYLLDFVNEKNRIEISALKGDKIIDYYIYENLLTKETRFASKGFYDSERQKISSEKNFERIFDKLGIIEIMEFNHSNNLGKKLKTTFIEALCYEIFKLNPEKLVNVIKAFKNNL